jgi:hypothetical protein
MKQPHGFTHLEFLDHMCKLYKIIYGLKQVPRAWFARLSSKLLELGFYNSRLDSSLFLLWTANLQLFILIYVDDIIITGNS